MFALKFKVIFAAAVVVVGAAIGSFGASGVSAQQPATYTPEQLTAGLEAWKKADCATCHGWSGNGHDTGPVPPGPSLREIGLDFAGIKEAIQCGRPGTNMPAHDRLAYTDKRCYGMTSAEIGRQKPRLSMSLQPKAIEEIAAYVDGVLKGKGPTTYAECEAYKGAGSPACAPYK